LTEIEKKKPGVRTNQVGENGGWMDLKSAQLRFSHFTQNCPGKLAQQIVRHFSDDNTNQWDQKYGRT
jgi:hypothetical protein